MSIPARPEYDPDLVIAASLSDVPKLLTRIEGLKAENGRLRVALIRAVDAVEQGWGYDAWLDEATEALTDATPAEAE